MKAKIRKRICLISIFFAIGLFLVYTAYSVYAVNFWTQYPMSEKLNGKPITGSDVLSTKVIGHARELGVDFFVYDNTGNTSTSTQIKIYATEGAQKSLAKNHITNYKYDNPIIGEISIIVLPIEEIDKNMKVVEVFYTSDYGSENLNAFSKYINKEYGFSDLIEANPDVGMAWLLILFWIIVFGIFILMLYYDILEKRKENAVTIVLGGSIKRNFVVLMLWYLIPMYTIFAIYCSISLFLNRPLYGMRLLFYAIITFSIIAILLQVKASTIDFKRDLSGAYNDKRLIKMNCALRITVTVLSIIVFVSTGWSVFGTVDLSRQKSFFEEHKNYDFYMIYDGENEGEAKKFYREFSDEAVTYQKCQNYEPKVTEKCPIVFVNDNALAELKARNKGLCDVFSKLPTDECNVLVSKGLYNSKNTEYINRCLDFYDLPQKDNENIIIYNCDVSTILLEDMMNNDGATRNMTENPVIVVVGDDYDLSSGVFASSNDTMYRIKDYDLKATCETYGWDYNQLRDTKINAYEGYRVRLNQMRSMAIVGVILSMIIFITQILASIALLNLQYKIKSEEMVIKLITGYNNWHRIGNILRYSIISLGILIITGCIVAIKIDFRIGAMLWIVSIISATIEVTAVSIKLKSADARNIVTILKGGML